MSWKGVQLLQSGLSLRNGQVTTNPDALSAAAEVWSPILLAALAFIVLLRWALRDYPRVRLSDISGGSGSGRPLQIGGVAGSGVASEPTHLTTILMMAAVVFAFYVQFTNHLPGPGSEMNWGRLLQLSPDPGSVLTAGWAFAPKLVAEGEYWRFVTPVLLHANLLHLIVNLRAWWSFRFVETWFGPLGYALIFGLSAIGSCAATYMFSGPGTVAMGASGAICGLLGADMVVSRLGECVQALLALAGFTAICLVLPFPVPVDHWGHWGGLFTGYAAGSALALLRLFLHSFSMGETPAARGG